MEPTIDQLCSDLEGAIDDVIDNYVTGHDIPLAVVVGVLHTIAHKHMKRVIEEVDDEENDG